MGITRVDSDGQPINEAFNFKRNREKSAYALRGILQGVVADKNLDPQELLFLDTWLRSQTVKPSGDVVDLLDLIGDILKDKVIRHDELAELQSLIHDIIEYGEQSSPNIEACINELLGLMLGISLDEVISPKEFELLDQWINANPQIAEHWPTNVIVDRIRDIKADGVVTPEELSDLLETLKQLTGNRFEETGAADGGVAEVFSDTVVEFAHTGNSMCFTGKFVCGTRSAVENTATRLGAIISQSVGKNLNALVVGTLASRDWRFTSHGRKIEKVIELRQNGNNIVILSERQWLSFL